MTRASPRDGETELPELLVTLLEIAGFSCKSVASIREFPLDPFPKEDSLIVEIRMRDVNGVACLSAAAREARERLAVLTPREMSVLIEVARGHSNKVTGHNLGISPRTIEVHRARIMRKLQASSLTDLVRFMIVLGLFKCS